MSFLSTFKRMTKNNLARGRRFLRFNRSDISNSYLIKFTNLESEKYDHFFGYYDISPFNSKNNFVLSCRRLRDSNSEEIEIGFFDLSEEKPKFNWVTGAEGHKLFDPIIRSTLLSKGCFADNPTCPWIRYIRQIESIC